MDFLKAFVITYRSFTTSEIFLRKLSERWYALFARHSVPDPSIASSLTCSSFTQDGACLFRQEDCGRHQTPHLYSDSTLAGASGRSQRGGGIAPCTFLRR